jgi:predicted enzyme related to lactoylglutathione lyase
MGRVIHFEIHADDPERACDFYRDVFGWEISKWDGPLDYWLVATGDQGEPSEPGIDGAIMRRMGGSPAQGQSLNSFVSTIRVNSIEQAERTIPDAGGEQVLPSQEIEGVGKVAYFSDTEGNVFGAMEPAS